MTAGESRNSIQIHIRYLNILRGAAGRKEETLSLPPEATVETLFRTLSSRGGMKSIIYGKKGEINHLIRICRKDTHHLLTLTDQLEDQVLYDMFVATFGG